MQGVDEKTPPNIPLFDKNKYRYPISKQFSNEVPTPILHSLTVHTKKRSLLKSNIHISKNMTFQNLLNYVFPNGSPSVISHIFKEAHSHIWIDLEDIEVKFDDLFD
ncbi:11539_t:CDS:2 [Dentiscutata heterogama]|uniref:11539_t:CDS:1 n=1 Tax=Dentiscutata heterogama TaxID=1316150 RepID=A0ACA9JVA1_9GLOM|nr:11539_t:CDS:2 [Dentiscutata heterogama]